MSVALPSQRNPQSKLSGFNQPRSLFLKGGVLILLFMGVFALNWTHKALPSSRQELLRAESDLADAHIREQLMTQNKLMLDEAKKIHERAQALHVLPQTWSEEQINLRQQHLMRQDINRLLMTIPRAPGQLFKPEEFDLSVTKSEEGLFEIYDKSKQPILITLRGTVYFGISEGAL